MCSWGQAVQHMWTSSPVSLQLHLHQQTSLYSHMYLVSCQSLLLSQPGVFLLHWLDSSTCRTYSMLWHQWQHTERPPVVFITTHTGRKCVHLFSWYLLKNYVFSTQPNPLIKWWHNSGDSLRPISCLQAFHCTFYHRLSWHGRSVRMMGKKIASIR